MGTERDSALAHSNFTRIQDTPLLILNVLSQIWQEMQTWSWLGKKMEFLWGQEKYHLPLCNARKALLS
jgi:hypothetical protein